MISAREYDLIKCYLSKGLMETYLTKEEKRRYKKAPGTEYVLPSELLCEFFRDRERYFEKVFNRLRGKTIIITQRKKKTIKELLNKLRNKRKRTTQENETTFITVITVEAKDENGKVKIQSLDDFVKDIQIQRL